MPDPPPVVATLVCSDAGAERELAWSTFLEAYSPLLLSVARNLAPAHDEAMDHYAFVVDRLREDEFRRIRAYTSNGAAEFSTWLGVIAKRLCIDNHRRRVGRPQGKAERSPREEVEWRARRNLADLLAADFDLRSLEDEGSDSPEDALWKSERRRHLTEVIGALDTRDQLLLTLRFEDDFGPERIATALGMPTRFHVHRRLKKVLRALRDALAERGIDAS